MTNITHSNIPARSATVAEAVTLCKVKLVKSQRKKCPQTGDKIVTRKTIANSKLAAVVRSGIQLLATRPADGSANKIQAPDGSNATCK